MQFLICKFMQFGDAFENNIVIFNTQFVAPKMSLYTAKNSKS
jgi:hypothetical protein